MKNYYSSQTIINRIKKYDDTHPDGLNGHFLMIHLGTSELRTDKLYNRLGEIIDMLQDRGYRFVTVKEMIEGRHP